MKTMFFENEQRVAEFGRHLGSVLEPSTILCLIGDLGTGKTTLTKYIAEGLGIKETITSPTFTIVKSYESGRLPLHHFDAYRLADEEDFYNIGGEEYLNGEGISVIEWADIIQDAIPENALYIFIERGQDEERTYQCTF